MEKIPSKEWRKIPQSKLYTLYPIEKKEDFASQSSTAVEDGDEKIFHEIKEVEGVELENPDFPIFEEGMPAQGKKGACRPEAELEAEVLI